MRKPDLASVFEWRPSGSPGATRVNVVMCTFDRVHWLPWTLAALGGQSDSAFGFVVWNNAPARTEDIKRYIRLCKPAFAVRVLTSRRNVGGLGRFAAAASGLWNPEAPCLFLDDDQLPERDWIAGMLATSPAGLTVVGFWAWRFLAGGTYWDRARCVPGESAQYIGTGGMLASAALVRDPGVFADLPKRFSFIEDLWLSYYLDAIRQVPLIAGPRLLRKVADGRDQSLSQRELKRGFLAWLRTERGWAV